MRSSFWCTWILASFSGQGTLWKDSVEIVSLLKLIVKQLARGWLGTGERGTQSHDVPGNVKTSRKVLLLTTDPSQKWLMGVIICTQMTLTSLCLIIPGSRKWKIFFVTYEIPYIIYAPQCLVKNKSQVFALFPLLKFSTNHWSGITIHS